MSTRTTLDDLIKVCEDILENRGAALRSTGTGAAFEPLLRADLGRAQALPLALRGAPIRELLDEANEEHDDWAHVCKQTLRAQQRLPLGVTTAARRAALARAEAALLPNLKVVQATYADSAHAARERAARMEAHREALAGVSVTAELTLADCFDAFNAAGARLGELIGERADARAAASRKEGVTLRGEMLALLGQLREAIRAEARRRPELGADIEAKIFGYLDELSRQRDGQATRATSDADDDATSPGLDPTTLITDVAATPATLEAGDPAE